MGLPGFDLKEARHIGLAEAKANLSGLVAQVERTGEPCVIMRYGRPAAVIAPLEPIGPQKTRARGTLARYADLGKRDLESGAVGRAVAKWHADAAGR